MPNLELGPNDYRKQDPKTGRWHLPTDPKLCRNMFFVALIMLGYVFWNRDVVSPSTLFGISALLSFAGGILFSIWIRDVH